MKKIKKMSATLAIGLVAFACNQSPQKTNLEAYVSSPGENETLRSALSYLESVCGKDGIKKTVILQGGKAIFEGTEKDVVQNVWSCTKSFTSTVLGLLIDEGKCSLDTRVSEFLPALKDNYPDIAFRHFATHTSGYKATGDDPAKGHGQSDTPFQPSPNPLYPVGSKYQYWDSSMNVFAWALTKAAGEPIEDYFKRKVADPIGMDPAKWDWKDFGQLDGITVNGGAGNKSNGIYISATEMAKFGQLFLNKGKWDGKQIIPENWIKAATSPQVGKLVNNDNTPYGFNWWTDEKFPGAPKDSFSALGFNNNKCIVIPQWDMVIVRLGLDGAVDDEKWDLFIRKLGEAIRG